MHATGTRADQTLSPSRVDDGSTAAARKATASNRRLAPVTSLWWLVVLCTCLGAEAARAGEVANVLVLYSNGRLVPGNIEVERGLSGAFASSAGRPVQVFNEFLDTPEFSGVDYELTMANYLREKYAIRRPDVVVAVAKDSLDFVLRHRADLFPGVVVVHAAVFRSYLDQKQRLPADVVGIPVEYDPAGTIEQALR